MDKEIKKLFEKIDDIILECLTDKPVKLKDSKFYQEYLKLKEEYKYGIN